MADNDPRTEVVKAPARQLSVAEKQASHLRSLEDKLLQSSLEVVGGACDFAHVDPNHPDKIPEEWIEELGFAAAQRKLRIAIAAWSNGKDAPKALDVATKVSVGIIRARSAEKGTPKDLRIEKVYVSMTVPATDFPTLVLEDK